MNELTAIEKINEEIKSIVSVAENVSLIATEAMLREATQAGINAVGFSLIARELRMFSEKTADGMESLFWLIEWQVAVNAGKHHREQNKVFLTQAHAAPACVGGQADVDEIEHLIVSQVCELQIRMIRTAKQCTTGFLIAHSVDVEDTHGGTMTPDLRQITQDMEEAIGNIALRIRKLESGLAEAGLWKRQRLFTNPVSTNEYLITDGTTTLLTDSGSSECSRQSVKRSKLAQAG